MEEEPMADSEDLQSLVDRFARARWITGENIVTPEPFKLTWTEFGRSQMLGIEDFLNNANCDNFPDPSNPESTESGRKIAIQLEGALEDLMPPALSSKERQILIGLALVFRKYWK